MAVCLPSYWFADPALILNVIEKNSFKADRAVAFSGPKFSEGPGCEAKLARLPFPRAWTTMLRKLFG